MRVNGTAVTTPPGTRRALEMLLLFLLLDRGASKGIGQILHTLSLSPKQAPPSPTEQPRLPIRDRVVCAQLVGRRARMESRGDHAAARWATEGAYFGEGEGCAKSDQFL